MQYRAFVPYGTDFEGIQDKLNGLLLAKIWDTTAFVVPLKNENHNESYVLDCVHWSTKNPTPPKFILSKLGIDRYDEVVIPSQRLIIVEAFPVVDDETLKKAVKELGKIYRGNIRRGKYPVITELKDRADGKMWAFRGPETEADALKKLLDQYCEGRFALSLEEEESVIEF